jgi:hypothetical protein
MKETQLVATINNSLGKYNYDIATSNIENRCVIGKRGMMANEWGYLGKAALANRAIARNTVSHEFQHYNDYKNGVSFNRNSLEHNAHLLDMRVAPSQGLPGRYWSESRAVLKQAYGYNGSFPKTYGPGQIWFNIYR